MTQSLTILSNYSFNSIYTLIFKFFHKIFPLKQMKRSWIIYVIFSLFWSSVIQWVAYLIKILTSLCFILNSLSLTQISDPYSLISIWVVSFLLFKTLKLIDALDKSCIHVRSFFPHSSLVFVVIKIKFKLFLEGFLIKPSLSSKWTLIQIFVRDFFCISCVWLCFQRERWVKQN